MLRDLHIRNLAVLEEATIELGPGFNVLSGETGAGKSIVVDSLALLAGVRASVDQIRTGAETLTVTGFFEPDGEEWRQALQNAGLEPGEELVVRREISRNGRSRVFVDDQPVTLKLLTELAPHLIRIHGQREELGLVDPELQRIWLDRVGGAEAATLVGEVGEAFAAWQGLAERLERLQGDQRARSERLELLRYQVEELDGSGLRADEETELRQERDQLRHFEKFQRALGGALEVLFDDENAARDALAKAVGALESIADWDPLAGEWIAELEELRIRLSELESAMRRRADGLEADPQRLEGVEDRLARLDWLFRKYGDRKGIEFGSRQLLALRATLAAELEELGDAEGSRDELTEKVAAALAYYQDLACRLSERRAAWARELERRVLGDLGDLALDKARFEVRLERRRRGDSPLVLEGQPVDFARHGLDQVVFTFSPNPGEELRPLAKVASGGELSRLYLAVQLATQGEGGAASVTMVFDEVDTGISGAEASVLASKVRRLAQGGQILAVTHLPQVASHADRHLKVSKKIQGGRTFTAVEGLDPSRRVEEVARMLAGSAITELSLSHARELIAAASGGAASAAGG